MTARTRRQQTRGGLEMRRVVCGVRDGRSVVLADGTAPTEHGFKALPGHVSAIMWATAADPSPGQVAEAAPVGIQAIPGPGETRLLMVHFPPATVMFGDGFDPDRKSTRLNSSH